MNDSRWVTVLDALPDESLLVQACLQQRPFAWQAFADRFLPTVLKTIHEIDIQASRGWPETRHHELARSVFWRLKQDDFQLLREWDDHTDFETWLVVVTRRVALQTD